MTPSCLESLLEPGPDGRTLLDNILMDQDSMLDEVPPAEEEDEMEEEEEEEKKDDDMGDEQVPPRVSARQYVNEPLTPGTLHPTAIQSIISESGQHN